MGVSAGGRTHYLSELKKKLERELEKEPYIARSPQGNTVKFQPPKILFFQSYKPCVVLSRFVSETFISE